MSDPRFPPVAFERTLEPYAHPQFIPGAPALNRLPLGVHNPAMSPGGDSAIVPGSAIMQAPDDADPVPVRDSHHYAMLFGQTTAPGANVSSKFLDQPTGKRNLLMMRNSSASANVYVEFSKDATLTSVLRLVPNQMVLFDTVVPQDDLYALADAVGAVLSYSYSTIRG
jgi:hypothetical protein